ncbi:MAG TPA: DUF5694 domain-containing protein [Rhizomicrobium sp.]|nr:DUF5694 domain-containing protein [Rhizomicrobium sp.]
MRLAVLVLAAAMAATSIVRAADKAPVQVMIVGMFHFSNPGHDLHNVQVDDVLLPEYQAQIAQIADGLSRFKPTQIDVEWPADLAHDRYALYLAGKLPPSRNEVVQLGFRLAKQAGLETVHGIDVDGDFPYDPVDAYAKAHGMEPLLQAENDDIEKEVRGITAMLKSSGIGPTLRSMNDPARVSQGNSFYRTALKIGGGTDQPGADLLTAWYRRNFLICANLLQLSRPGDRVVVFYGSGHAFLLRQCVTESPGFELVEPNSYLPQ